MLVLGHPDNYLQQDQIPQRVKGSDSERCTGQNFRPGLEQCACGALTRSNATKSKQARALGQVTVSNSGINRRLRKGQVHGSASVNNRMESVLHDNSRLRYPSDLVTRFVASALSAPHTLK